jgi:hypothetical protein
MRPFAACLLLGLGLWAGEARADEPDDDPARWLKELDLEAGAAEADLRLRELDLRDGVKVRLSPYHLRAERIHLSLGKWGVRVRGAGVLTFCPCDDPPVAIGFRGGWAGPPDELIVEAPTLRVLGVPVLWLPYLWLRSPRKLGLTTPEVSFRGPDGLFVGQGVHLPWGHGLELGAGVYARGGFATTADLVTDRTSTLVRFDFRRASDVANDAPSGAGLSIDARGAGGSGFVGLAWDVDAIRGARGLRTTLELDGLARPYDRATGVAHVGPVRAGVDAMDARGAPLDGLSFVRPWVGVGGGVAHGALGGSNGSISFGPRWVRERGAETVGDATWATTLAGPLGLLAWEASSRVDGRIARAGRAGEVGDARLGAAAGEARVELSLPLVKAISIDRAAGGPPVLHVLEPLVRAAGLAARASGDRTGLAGFVAAPAFAERTRDAGLFTLGLRSRLGSMYGGIAPGRDPFVGKLTAELSAGALGTNERGAAIAAGQLTWASRDGGGGEALVELRGAATRAFRGGVDEGAAVGWLTAGRLSWAHARDGLGAELRGAARGDVPVLAGFAMFGADLAPRLTTATGLSAPGATLGVGAALPVVRGFRLAGELDVYGPSSAELLRDARLVDVRGTLRYRHPCGCFRMALRGGKLVGREGVDVFATFELARAEASEPRDY